MAKISNHRHMQVLYLVCQGLDHKQMAVKLDISNNTLNLYVSDLLQFTGCRNRIELINRVIKVGLLTELERRVGHDFH